MPSVARALAIPMHEQPALPWELSVRLGEEPPAAHEFEVAAGSRVVGRAIRELPLGEHTWITLVVRDGAATRPGGSLELEAGDRVLLLADADELERARAALRRRIGLAISHVSSTTCLPGVSCSAYRACERTRSASLSS